HLNLPTEIKFQNNNKISYLYNAQGIKRAKIIMEQGRRSITDYLSAFQYKDDVLTYIQHAEGYINVEQRSKIDDLPDLPPNFPINPGFPTDPRFPILRFNQTPVNDMGAVRPIYDGGGLETSDEFNYEFAYVYHYKDHLGNIRLSYTDKNGDGKISDYTNEIIDENNYYPFGLEHEGYNGKESDYKYKYQGQERQDELNLNWDSFKWRNYDYALGRFMSVDPLAQEYSYQSPYNFSENRVVDGRELEGLEYVSVHHYANGSVAKTEYYKMSNSQVKSLGGTPAGIHNSVPYGSQGRGVVHYYYNESGNKIDNRTGWEMRQTGGDSDLKYHGLYSGPGSITKDGVHYNFDAQPIDLADAIAKRHDMDYADVAGDDYANFLEDTRTLQSDLDMVQRLDDYANPFKTVQGIEKPIRTSFSTEMDGSTLGQRIVIQALATYKQWKIDNNLGNNDVYKDNRDAFSKQNPATAEIIDLIKP
ncbi:MAG: RHS repeat domain-containing protein, partial [Weeksellaceae bacterium]